MIKTLFAVLAALTSLFTKAQSVDTLTLDTLSAVQYTQDADAPAFRSTGLEGRFFHNYADALAPTAMFGFGVVALKNPLLKNLDLHIRQEVLEEPGRNINHRVEDVLQYVPMYSVFALNFAGLKSQNGFIDRVALYGLSNTIMSHTVSKMKSKFNKIRPDGSNKRSFPSGHTATAFSAAEFMRLEYKDQSPLYGIAAYAAAATTGALRIYHNSHWFSDVVAGAGIGILSTQVSYYVYPRLKKFVNKQLGFKAKGLNIGPAYQQGTPGVALVYRPD